MMDALAAEPDFFITEGHIGDDRYERELLHTVFALVPAAYEMATTRLCMAVNHGAIPVVVTDYLRTPFGDGVPASSALIVVRWHDVPRLATTLREIPPAEVARRQAALPALAAAWSYEHDAVEHMVRELAARAPIVWP